MVGMNYAHLTLKKVRLFLEIIILGKASWTDTQAETSEWEEQKKRKKTLKQDAKEVRREDKRKKKTEGNMDKNNSFTDI